MRDVFDYVSPRGMLGRLADLLFLQDYMAKLLTRRAAVIRLEAERQCLGWAS